MTTREPVIPAPEQRVRDYLNALTASGLRLEIETIDDYTLDGADIRDVLNELESWRSRAEELEDKRREAITRYLSVHAHYNDDVRLAIEELSDEP